jgi:cytochrome c oxidase cbb3-type subunit 4
MDVNTLRSLMTLLLLGVFLGRWVWAWSGRQRDRFAEAAAIPLNDDEPSAPAEIGERSRT